MSDNIESKIQTNNALLDLKGQNATLQEGAIGIGISNLGGKDDSITDSIGINHGNITRTEVISNVVIHTPQVIREIYRLLSIQRLF